MLFQVKLCKKRFLIKRRLVYSGAAKVLTREILKNTGPAAAYLMTQAPRLKLGGVKINGTCVHPICCAQLPAADHMCIVPMAPAPVCTCAKYRDMPHACDHRQSPIEGATVP